MKKVYLICSVLFLTVQLSSCQSNNGEKSNLTNSEEDSVSENSETEKEDESYINPKGNKIISRFNVPEGYNRVKTEKNSFAEFLQNLPLKPDGSPVLLFNGNEKGNQDAHLAVVDLPIGKRDLHQCADAIMRLRADYLFGQKRYNEIEFLFVSGKRSNYATYLAGRTPNSTNLWSYLENVFNLASTLSLDKQLKSKDLNSIEVGDVFIKGGSPGHAVIVVDKCVNTEGKVKFMLAQSYMPAQETQVLVNPQDPNNPWYDLDFGDILETAEYTFTKNQLKSF
jgi:hypothetical protein